MTSMTLLAMLFGGASLALLSTGLLVRVYDREEQLAQILDLPYGEQDVDLEAVTERHSALVENTIGLAGKMVDQLDAKGSLLTRLEAARLPVRPGEFSLIVGGAGVIGGAIAALATSNIAIGVAVLLAAPFAGSVYLNRRVAKRKARFEEQFPEALSIIASSLSAGHTFLRSIQMMTEEAGGPLAEEFGRVVTETQLGDPLIDALERMAERLQIRDVDWAVQAVKIQQTVGGKLADLLHTLADFIRAREEIRREIDVLTAEGRLSAFVLGGLPVILFFAVNVFNPGYTDPIFEGWGLVWLGGAALAVVASISIILRMVKSVEV